MNLESRKAKTKKKTDEITFITRGTQPPAGTVDLHRETVGKTLTRKLSEVKDDWRIMSTHVIEMISATDTNIGKAGYSLDEVSVSLGFNAKGKLAFIAEAGVESSVTIVFKRGKSS